MASPVAVVPVKGWLKTFNEVNQRGDLPLIFKESQKVQINQGFVANEESKALLTHRFSLEITVNGNKESRTVTLKEIIEKANEHLFLGGSALRYYLFGESEVPGFIERRKDLDLIWEFDVSDDLYMKIERHGELSAKFSLDNQEIQQEILTLEQELAPLVHQALKSKFPSLIQFLETLGFIRRDLEGFFSRDPHLIGASSYSSGWLSLSLGEVDLNLKVMRKWSQVGGRLLGIDTQVYHLKTGTLLTPKAIKSNSVYTLHPGKVPLNFFAKEPNPKAALFAAYYLLQGHPIKDRAFMDVFSKTLGSFGGPDRWNRLLETFVTDHAKHNGASVRKYLMIQVGLILRALGLSEETSFPALNHLKLIFGEEENEDFNLLLDDYLCEASLLPKLPGIVQRDRLMIYLQVEGFHLAVPKVDTSKIQERKSARLAKDENQALKALNDRRDEELEACIVKQPSRFLHLFPNLKFNPYSTLARVKFGYLFDPSIDLIKEYVHRCLDREESALIENLWGQKELTDLDLPLMLRLANKLPESFMPEAFIENVLDRIFTKSAWNSLSVLDAKCLSLPWAKSYLKLRFKGYFVQIMLLNPSIFLIRGEGAHPKIQKKFLKSLPLVSDFKGVDLEALHRFMEKRNSKFAFLALSHLYKVTRYVPFLLLMGSVKGVAQELTKEQFEEALRSFRENTGYNLLNRFLRGNLILEFPHFVEKEDLQEDGNAFPEFEKLASDLNGESEAKIIKIAQNLKKHSEFQSFVFNCTKMGLWNRFSTGTYKNLLETLWTFLRGESVGVRFQFCERMLRENVRFTHLEAFVFVAEKCLKDGIYLEKVLDLFNSWASLPASDRKRLGSLAQTRAKECPELLKKIAKASALKKEEEDFALLFDLFRARQLDDSYEPLLRQKDLEKVWKIELARIKGNEGLFLFITNEISKTPDKRLLISFCKKKALVCSSQIFSTLRPYCHKGEELLPDLKKHLSFFEYLEFLKDHEMPSVLIKGKFPDYEDLKQKRHRVLLAEYCLEDSLLKRAYLLPLFACYVIDEDTTSLFELAQEFPDYKEFIEQNANPTFLMHFLQDAFERPFSALLLTLLSQTFKRHPLIEKNREKQNLICMQEIGKEGFREWTQENILNHIFLLIHLFQEQNGVKQNQNRSLKSLPGRKIVTLEFPIRNQLSEESQKFLDQYLRDIFKQRPLNFREVLFGKSKLPSELLVELIFKATAFVDYCPMDLFDVESFDISDFLLLPEIVDRDVICAGVSFLQTLENRNKEGKLGIDLDYLWGIRAHFLFRMYGQFLKSVSAIGNAFNGKKSIGITSDYFLAYSRSISLSQYLDERKTLDLQFACLILNLTSLLRMQYLNFGFIRRKVVKFNKQIEQGLFPEFRSRMKDWHRVFDRFPTGYSNEVRLINKMITETEHLYSGKSFDPKRLSEVVHQLDKEIGQNTFYPGNFSLSDLLTGFCHQVVIYYSQNHFTNLKKGTNEAQGLEYLKGVREVIWSHYKKCDEISLGICVKLLMIARGQRDLEIEGRRVSVDLSGEEIEDVLRDLVEKFDKEEIAKKLVGQDKDLFLLLYNRMHFIDPFGEQNSQIFYFKASLRLGVSQNKGLMLKFFIKNHTSMLECSLLENQQNWEPRWNFARIAKTATVAVVALVADKALLGAYSLGGMASAGAGMLADYVFTNQTSAS